MMARKERWKKGLTKGYDDDGGDVPSRIGGDDSYIQQGDSRTGGSITSYDTDFTTEVSSEDSKTAEYTASSPDSKFADYGATTPVFEKRREP